MLFSALKSAIKKYGWLLIVAALAFTGAGAHAAGFDCQRAQSKAEKIICADGGLSRLDDQLGAVYAQVQNAAGDGKAEKAMQLAWLRTRNACADAACLARAYATRIAELQARSAGASPLVGIWKKEYGCEGASGVYEDRCRQGERDVFMLAIQVSGRRVCIEHMATSNLGNRVDEAEGDPTMTGEFKGNTATVRFRSSWGGTGSALLRVENNTLYWKVVARDDGQSLLPAEETLTRMAAGPYDHLPACQ